MKFCPGRQARPYRSRTRSSRRPAAAGLELKAHPHMLEHYKNMMNADTNYGLEEAGMAQLDDSVGALLKALDDVGETNNTIVVFSTDNGAETFTYVGITPFRASKGTIYEGGLASFNLRAIKAKIDAAIRAHEGR
jgi:arylsulfatase A-like enzyme